MLWIRFDEEDRWSPAPPFCLLSLQGEQVCMSDFRGECNLVLFFAHERDSNECLAILEGFATHQAEYRAEDARVIAVIPETQQWMEEDPSLTASPVIILSDPDGSARSRYANIMDESLVSDEDNLIFVLDQYGAPYTAVVGKDLDAPTLHEEIVKWLRYVGMQCPE